MSSMRSASSSTLEQHNTVKLWTRAHGGTFHGDAADQVSDGLQVNELVHLEVVESSWRGDHNVHSTLHQVDLAPPVAAAVDADTGRRWDRSSRWSHDSHNDKDGSSTTR